MDGIQRKRETRRGQLFKIEPGRNLFSKTTIYQGEMDAYDRNHDNTNIHEKTMDRETRTEESEKMRDQDEEGQKIYNYNVSPNTKENLLKTMLNRHNTVVEVANTGNASSGGAPHVGSNRTL